MSQSYHEEISKKNTIKLRELLKDSPPFLKDYFRSIEDYTSSRTRIGYAYDLKIFFHFLTTESNQFMDIKVTNFSVDDLKRITSDDIEDFMEYLSYYVRNEEVLHQNRDTEIIEHQFQNESRGKSRKLSAVRSMFTYYFKKRKIDANPSELVDTPKLYEKAKVYLNVDEIARLLDEVDSGEHLTNKQKEYHRHTRKRDLAILTLLLGTGIRISECVGLNINDINFDDGSFKVTRKGGNEAILYFGEEVEISLNDYMDERESVVAMTGHEEALFLSLQNKRMTDRAIQILVKKYSQMITSLKKITPHKLRSSFGTNLYRQTGDIYLVADLLGHKDVNTTRKHYADTHEDKGRRAIRELRLRED